MKKLTIDISGMGGSYEAMCQTMLWRGILHLAETKPPVAMWTGAKEVPGIFGVLTIEGKALQALEDSIIRPGDDCTGAMHHAVMSALHYIHNHGVEQWLDEVRKHDPARLYEAEVTL